MGAFSYRTEQPSGTTPQMDGSSPRTEIPTPQPADSLLRGDRLDVHSTSGPIEPHLPVDEREDRVIAAQADVLAGQKLRPALPDDDVPRDDGFAAKFLDAQALADAVPPIFDAALSLFMCHCRKLRVES